MEKIAIKSAWADAPKGGAVIGIIVTAVLYLKFWILPPGSALGALFTIAEFVIVAYCIYYYSKLRGRAYGAWGYTYGQSLGYILVMMLYAGLIYGVGYFFLVNYVAAGYFEETLDQTLEQMTGILGGMMTEESVNMVWKMYSNPLYWIFTGILGMLVYGGIIGLFVSAFVKRPPEIFNNQEL